MGTFTSVDEALTDVSAFTLSLSRSVALPRSWFYERRTAKYNLTIRHVKPLPASLRFCNATSREQQPREREVFPQGLHQAKPPFSKMLLRVK